MSYNQDYYQTIWHRILRKYTVHDPIRDFGDLMRARIVARLLRRFVLAEGTSALTLADCGCGNWLYLGSLYRELASYPHAVSLQGIDYAEEAIRFGLAKFQEERPANVQVTFRVGELHEILETLPAEGLDSILCLEVLEHVAYDRLAVEAYCRILRPGGHLIVSVPSSQPFPLSLNWFEYRFLRKAFTEKDALVGHLRRYRISEMASLPPSFMQVKAVEPYGFWGADYIKRVSSWLERHVPFLGRAAFPVFVRAVLLEHALWNAWRVRRSEGFFMVFQKLQEEVQ